ncbi:MAG: 2-oxoacid:acceptor oxidoreductase family protein [Candidatus Staskawiczbacteria bacterium]|nr:2-oxoacid:acceptor oxidoreductase family protein [Candidatus Staskawiczbacteria bacterium]
MNNNKNFNIVITGVGGQGIITLISIINEAALVEGYDLKSSELHGLSQRGGAVEAYIRFGKKVASPLFSFKKADLVLSLEMTEALRAIVFKNPETIFAVNENFIFFDKSISKDYVSESLNNSIGKNIYWVRASDICKKELNNEVVSSMYILGFCVKKGIIKLKAESVRKAIENIIPSKYLEMNKRAFELALL